MTYVYLKNPPQDIEKQLASLAWANRLNRFRGLLPTIMMTVGASLIISVGYPIVSYELTAFVRQTRRPQILSPVPDEALSEARGYISPQPANPISDDQRVLASSVDYTNIDSWFNFARPQEITSNITDYTISIPKLRIKDALVTIGGRDLDKSLIHYGGTANPGEVGNPVIFGHSILPQFYDPENYISIFSLLPTLRPGDEIMVKFDGIIYTYQVTDYYEVSPDEIDILEQRFDKKELTLVTCVPPGTYLRRGIIKAQLVKT
ncbi:MAG: Sortase family protein [Candidatus Beckwithbacteria bacterium GW2011_GWB1_47_15]|uniref:Sortase family protein n=1 Tax=Candidatus Beckwithbacteria bacterium GW2011_GWB1_47_15 TaxID=1618371 RepID=A0A0G1U6L9_9BACT|nr:MAG: putative sortase [Candidatus Beckwithbacteria bacterium GW2011_GWC1_49_16]AQS30727.1 hypothetical protein [uncultured bacterium]KKU35914.1 MAG: Sortase family protein [Candidatus Beckwithbacteria bacterium GW2011_GWA1_46_30]KKU61878.1 MAG: Sortase family protein [Candidatus Beckwithbacteria bacterium GW2011_GWB1_47_15]KKU72568.1 MAG: Sortase family protein [Candidatus Beckwithbacteria bacterium GW2011_GWA2_47_25]KKW04265.1 MAG: Sortase family protein [Candidatus Beckwithbacteria bacter